LKLIINRGDLVDVNLNRKRLNKIYGKKKGSSFSKRPRTALKTKKMKKEEIKYGFSSQPRTPNDSIIEGENERQTSKFFLKVEDPIIPTQTINRFPKKSLNKLGAPLPLDSESESFSESNEETSSNNQDENDTFQRRSSVAKKKLMRQSTLLKEKFKSNQEKRRESLKLSPGNSPSFFSQLKRLQTLAPGSESISFSIF
jgi:hypothetical protein